MPYYVIADGVVFFIAWFFLHILVWRVLKVKREMLWLFILFLGAPFCSMFFLALYTTLTRLEVVSIALVHFSLAVIYLQTYPALKYDVPSFRILMLLDKNRKNGLSKDEINANIKQNELFDDKLTGLKDDALIVLKDGKLTLSLSGKILALIFAAYRRLLRVENGKG